MLHLPNESSDWNTERHLPVNSRNASRNTRCQAGSAGGVATGHVGGGELQQGKREREINCSGLQAEAGTGRNIAAVDGWH